jgi:hypothetical protein
MASVKGAQPDKSYVGGWPGHGHHAVRFGMPPPDDRHIMHSAVGLPVAEFLQGRIHGDDGDDDGHEWNVRGARGWGRPHRRNSVDRHAAGRVGKHHH